MANLKRGLVTHVLLVLSFVCIFALMGLARAETIQTATVVKSDVRLREQPNGTTIMKLKKGAKVNITGDAVSQDDLSWYPVEYKGKEGYLREDVIKLSEPMDSASQTSDTNKAVVVTSTGASSIDYKAAKKAASKYLCNDKRVKKGTVSCTFDLRNDSLSFQYIYSTTDDSFAALPMIMGCYFYGGQNAENGNIHKWISLQVLYSWWAIDSSISVSQVEIKLPDGSRYSIAKQNWTYGTGYADIKISNNSEMLQKMIDKGFTLTVTESQGDYVVYEAKKGSAFHNALKYAWKVWFAAGLADEK